MKPLWLSVTVVAGLAGCAGWIPNPAVERASAELRCPPADIVAIPRDDIEVGVVDMRVCGQAVRYQCFKGHCINQAILDPRDVDALMSLPERRATTAANGVAESSTLASTPEHRRLCRDRADFNATRNCVFVPPR